MIIRHCFMALLCLLFSTEMSGQQPFTAINLTNADGLPSNTIYDVFADSDGYLWFSTDKGLAIYNGTDFRSFTIDDGLPDNEIFAVTEDLDKRKWLVSFNGELCFYKNGIFHTYKNTPWLKLPFNIHISNISVEDDGSVTILFSGFKYMANVRGNHLSIYDVSRVGRQTALNRESFTNVKKMEPNHYELTSIDKRVQVDTLGNLLAVPYKFSKIYWSAIIQGRITLIDHNAIYNRQEGIIFKLRQPTFLFERIVARKNKQDFWIGRPSGLFINDSIPLIRGHFITSITQDNNNNYWVGTREHGAFLLYHDVKQVATWKHAYQGDIRQACIVNGSLHFITDTGGIYQLDRDKIRNMFSLKNTVPEDAKRYVFLITQDLDYIILSSTKSQLLRKTPTANYKITDISEQLKPLGFRSLKKAFQNDTFLYFFEINRMSRTSLKDVLQLKPTPGKQLIDATLDQRIHSFAENKADHSMWISRSDGIFKLSDTLLQEQKQFQQTHFREMKFFKDYLVGFTDKNQFFICSNFNNKVVIAAVKNDGSIYEHIYPIDDHRAIVSTNKYYKVIQLYPPTGTKPNYTFETLENVFIPAQADFITADSAHCYFFQKGTITRVATSMLFVKAAPPTPVFLEFRTRSRTLNPSSRMNIAYTESGNISIRFDNISFSSKDIISEYSVSQDEEDHWNEITGNEINLNTPGYGTFTVKVRSRTLSSGFSKPVVLTIHIAKPFWATWWFITLCAFAFLALIWLTIVSLTWRRLRKKQKEHDADMKYQQSEYKALNALMNPHFIFNSLNNIQGLINKDEKRTANQYLVIFSDLVRQNMHNISKGFISLQEELTLIENYLTLEKLRFKDMIHYEFRVEEEVDLDDIMIPPLMIQPLVENAVKHGLLPKQSPQSKVIIQVYEKKDILYIVIEDNGIGLTQSLKGQNKLHESFGLSNLKKRTEHLKKIQQHELTIDVFEVKNEDGTVAGTRAVVKMQFQ